MSRGEYYRQFTQPIMVSPKLAVTTHYGCKLKKFAAVEEQIKHLDPLRCQTFLNNYIPTEIKSVQSTNRKDVKL